MELIKAIILGIIQGLCEFLPVSSSGHLTLASKLLGISEGDVQFTMVMLHVGTLIAVFIVYRKQIWELLKKPFQRKTFLLIVSTVATVIIYLVCHKLFKGLEGNGIALGCSFLFTAAILLFTDFVVPSIIKKEKNIEKLTFSAAIGVGAMQGIGILPGVSRSGSTIAGARLFGLDKESAAEYSFLMSIPAILGGLVTEIPDIIEKGAANIDWLSIAVGMVAAAASGYFAIRFMIQLITKKKLWGFAVYVGILGVFLILDAGALHLIF